MILQNLISPKSANCSCDINLENKLYQIDQELMNKADSFYLDKKYEVGKGLTQGEIMNILYRRQIILKSMNMQCVTSIDQIYTEETCVNKPCH